MSINLLAENDPRFIHEITLNATAPNESMEMVEMQAMEETMQEYEDVSPVTTKKAYNPKIKEFKLWCDTVYASTSIEQRYTVTGPKLYLFLRTSVINRVNKRSKEGNVIQLPTIYQYVAAITHYYQTQVSKKTNGYPHPRTACVSILKTCRLRSENAARVSCKDRGLGTLIDGYTTNDEIASLSYYYIGKNTFHDLRNCTAFLLSHFCLLRGESARAAELPDLQVVNLEKEGPTRFCPALLLVMRNGKTNKSGRLDIGACIRNVDVRICPFMITAMYFFSMFQVDCKPFPDFSSSESWYFTKLLQTGNDSTTEWSYAAHCQAMEKALKACNIGSSKVTHMARGAGARMCDLGGVDESMIRRLGRWNADCMSSSYVTGLPRPAMRNLGGYGTQQGMFYLPRSAVEPPIELQKKVFPQVDECIDKLNSGVLPDNVAARGFLALLKTMRITFLQDSVFIMKDFPHHRVFNHQLLQDPLYLSFKSTLESVMSSESTPQELLLERAMPILTKVIKDQFDAQDEMIRHLKIQNEELKKQLADIATGRAPVPITVTVDINESGQRVSSTSSATTGSSSNLADPINADDNTATVTSTSNTVNTFTTSNNSHNDQQNHDVITPPTPLNIQHACSRGVSTVTDLWREYSVGLGGGYSVSELNRVHPQWFLPHDRNFHYRRMRIINGIIRIAEARGITIETCVELAENRRAATKRSLHSLGKDRTGRDSLMSIP